MPSISKINAGKYGVFGIGAKETTAPFPVDGVGFDGSESISSFGQCSTAANTAGKTVQLSSDITLQADATVYVQFVYGNTASNPTLNVNGTGAKSIMLNGTTAADSGAWAAGEVAKFVYDGTYWQAVLLAAGSTSAAGRVKIDNTLAIAGEAADAAALGTALAAKQDIVSATQGQYMGFDADGNAAAITPDAQPTSGSHRLATSGGIYAAILDQYKTATISNVAVASFTDGADNVPVQTLNVAINPVQDLNGYDSPWIDSNEVNKDPYTFRPMHGTATRIGNREYDTLIGGTVAWNQQIQNGNFADGTTGWYARSINAPLSASDGVGTVTVNTAGSYNRAQFGVQRNIAGVVGHKYLVAQHVRSSITARFTLDLYGNSPYYYLTANTWKRISTIFAAVSISDGKYYFYNEGTETLAVDDKLDITDVMVIDLTLAFSSTIADYIYSLETATPGAGVAWFRKPFPKPYYPYNAGTLIHVNASAHKTVGFNQWNEEWEKGGFNESTGEKNTAVDRIRSKNLIPVIPTQTYYFVGARAKIFYYDASGGYIGCMPAYLDSGFIIDLSSVGAYYVMFQTTTAYGTTYNHDICINLSWSGTRNGEYKPYEMHNYALDSDLVLRGIPKKDASGNLYYDGDTYEADGTVTRRYRVYTFTENDVWYSGYGGFYAYLPSNVKKVSKSVIPNIMLEGYVTVDYNHVSQKTVSLLPNDRFVYILDSSLSDSTVRSAMVGKQIVFELATPTTESADPFTSPQIVDDWGTEEYVVTEQNGVAMPVGHQSYQANICPISGWTGATIKKGIFAILSQPVDFVGTTGDFTFTVGAVGDGLSYRWYVSTDGTTWTGTDNRAASITLAITDARKAYDWRCKVTDSFGHQLLSAVVNIVATAAEAKPQARPDVYDTNPLSVSWQSEAGTIYGGTLTWLGENQWKLKATSAIVDMGAMTYTAQGSNNLFYSTSLVNSIKAPASSSATANARSNKFRILPANTAATGYGDWGLVVSINARVYVRLDDTYSDPAAVKTALVGAQFVYELATPVEYTLTIPNSEIKTLLGANNIFADTGNINTLTYRRNINAVIEEALSGN